MLWGDLIGSAISIFLQTVLGKIIEISVPFNRGINEKNGKVEKWRIKGNVSD